MTKLAFVTDLHIPYHDPRAISVAMQIVSDFQPDIRTSGSDAMDFYSVSHFDHNPERLKKGGLQREIDEWKKCEREWNSAAPKAHVFFLVGNHEDRLRKYLWKHPELSDLDVLKLQTVLGLDELGIYWEKEKGVLANLELILHDRLVVKHGDIIRKFSAYTAKGELENEQYAISTLTGHTHRGGTHYATGRNGTLIAQEGFCLCSLNPEYIQGTPNWQQGIVLSTVTKQSVVMEAVPFFKRSGKTRAIWRDKEYIE